MSHYSDPRFTIHNVTVQQLPPSGRNPRRRLSHVVKARPSAKIGGAYQPVATRVALPGRWFRK